MILEVALLLEIYCFAYAEVILVWVSSGKMIK